MGGGDGCAGTACAVRPTRSPVHGASRRRSLARLPPPPPPHRPPRARRARTLAHAPPAPCARTDMRRLRGAAAKARRAAQARRAADACTLTDCQLRADFSLTGRATCVQRLLDAQCECVPPRSLPPHAACPDAVPLRPAQSMSLGWPGGQLRMAPAYASSDSSRAPAHSDMQSPAASEGPGRRSSWCCVPTPVHLPGVRRARERGPPPDRVLWKLGASDASPGVSSGQTRNAH